MRSTTFAAIWRGEKYQAFRAQMGRAAAAGGGEVDRARACLRILDQARHVGDAPRGRGDEHQPYHASMYHM